MQSATSQRVQSWVGDVGQTPAPNAPSSMPFAVGTTINDKYEVLELIGCGGVGIVVSARHVRLDDRVALKFLRPEFAANEDAVRRFTIEARANFRIKSDHVVRLLDVDALPDGTPFIVMELLEGIDLARVLETQGALPVELALECTLQACEALAAAHACQVIHRDVKPENLFLTPAGPHGRLLKMLDFGISKLALTPRSAGAPSAPLVGSPPYMSPEQVRASDEADVRSDIWSLGCVLYELLAGEGPFMRESLEETFSAVRDAEPAPLHMLCPAAPTGLEAVLLRCLEKDPERRFADVGELARALAPFAADAERVAERCRQVLAASGVEPAHHRISDSGLVAIPPRAPMFEAALESSAKAEPDASVALDLDAELDGVNFRPAQRRTLQLLLATFAGAALVLGYSWLRAAPMQSIASEHAVVPAPGTPSAEASLPEPLPLVEASVAPAVEPELPAPASLEAVPVASPAAPAKKLAVARAKRSVKSAPARVKEPAHEIDVGF